MAQQEADRQSTYSSFYRGRKDSFDVLGSGNNGRQTPIYEQFDSQSRDHPSERERDDRSSFFQPNANRLSRGSGDMLMSQQYQPGRPSAGYNRDSFFDPGRSMPVRGLNDYEGTSPRHEEEEMGFLRQQQKPHPEPEEEEAEGGWDVYNDFNNKGPKYSDAFGVGLGNHGGYQELPTPSPSFARSQQSYSRATSQKGGISPVASQTSLPAHAQTELVTVPVLGPDWKKSEIEGMRKATKREERNEARYEKAKRWWRDQHGFCGGFATRKTVVIILFVFCILLAVVLAITIPRVPGFAFNSTNPLSNNTQSDLEPEFSRSPANFSFPALLNIQIDTHSNILPLKVNSIHCDVYCLDTDQLIGGGEMNGTTISAKKFQPESIPVTFNYTAVNDTDTTWLLFYNACRNPSQYPDGVRPGFNLHVILRTKIAGIPHTVTSSTSITKVGCPFQLPNNSV